MTGPASQCPSGTTCQRTAGCATARCDPAAAAIVTTACAATCRAAAAPQPTAAAFADYSDLIIVSLNANAVLDDAAGCEGVLRPASVQLLGSFPRCEAQGDKLYLYPSSDASVVPGSVLFLNKGQTALRDAVTGVPLTGKASVANCTSCNPPKPAISGPSVVHNPCAANAAAAPHTAAAVFDGSQSHGGAGRPLASAAWSLRGASGDAQLVAAMAATNAKDDIGCVAGAAAEGTLGVGVEGRAWGGVLHPAACTGSVLAARQHSLAPHKHLPSPSGLKGRRRGQPGLA
jgi:hypothetical protein